MEITWQDLINAFKESVEGQNLDKFLQDEKLNFEIYPPKDQIYRALDLIPFEDVKVVILGQDPYHGQGQANGLAFSVNPDIQLPPSLRNIYTELSSDLGLKCPNHGDLTPWAKQGVLLLNTVLTVRKGEAHSHANQGWEILTNHLIQTLSREKQHLVFILWGKPAQTKRKLIDETKHLIISSPHPSPLSAYRGFFGSQPFSKVNHYLSQHNIQTINWQL